VFATGSVLVSIMPKDGKRDGDQREMCVEPRSCEHQNKGEAGLKNFSERSHRSSDETGKIPGLASVHVSIYFPPKLFHIGAMFLAGKAVVALCSDSNRQSPSPSGTFL
jgi:hypothetical protein